MESKDTLSSCSNSDEQQMQQLQDKEKRSCMVSFRQLHSHLKLFSNNDLKGTRTQFGLKRAFVTLFGQDLETFIGTIFLNMDQLDKEEFQEIGSIAAFKLLERQFQMIIKSWIYLDDEYKCVFNANHDHCVTKFLNEVNSRAKVPSNKTMNRNKPVEQISVVKQPVRHILKGYRFSIKKTSVVHEKTMTPRSYLRWKPTGKIFKTVDLRWVPTGKIFTSSTTKVDSEPTNGSNADITNQYECEQTPDVSAGSKSCSSSRQDSYITTRIGITIPPSHNNAKVNM
nr:hypothetical protein [Tanacetum cinerariifolium]